MNDQQKPDQENLKPIGTWGSAGEDRQGDAADATRGAALDPIPGTPAPAPLVDQPDGSTDQEPKSSPETEHEFDRLRRE